MARLAKSNFTLSEKNESSDAGWLCVRRRRRRRMDEELLPGLENNSLATETEETHEVQRTDNQKNTAGKMSKLEYP